LLQSILFSSLMDKNLFFLKRRLEGCFSIYFLNISVQIFLFNLNLFYHHYPVGKRLRVGKIQELGSYCTLFPTRPPLRYQKKCLGSFFSSQAFY
jgi:hypothetical protein